METAEPVANEIEISETIVKIEASAAVRNNVIHVLLRTQNIFLD
jgi:hypothetical protein